jgi:hypothetical protein
MESVRNNSRDAIAIPRIDLADLSLYVERDAATLSLYLLGRADLRHAAALASYLPLVHSSAVTMRITEVVVDLRELEFMSSGCFKAFVTWLVAIQELRTAPRYRIRFLSDARKTWQARSLQALSCFAVDLVVVDR